MKIPKRYENAKWADVPERAKAPIIDVLKGESGGLYIHGAVGCGKTHLVYGIQDFLREHQYSAIIWNVPELLHEIKQDFNRDEKRDPMADFSGETASVFRRPLILDDIGVEKPSEFAVETLYLIVNDRYNNLMPTIFTSNCSLGELAERIGERTASRIAEMCQIVELTGEDRRLKK